MMNGKRQWSLKQIKRIFACVLAVLLMITTVVTNDIAFAGENTSTVNQTAGGAETVAEENGSSNYLVEFSIDELSYIPKGGNRVALSEILTELKLSGTVTEAVSSDEACFTVTKDASGDERTVEILQFFTDEKKLTVTIADTKYEITVAGVQETDQVPLQVQTRGTDNISLSVNNIPKAEVALSVGTTRLNYANFKEDLWNALKTNEQIDRNSVTFIEAQGSREESQDSFAWKTYDHSTSEKVSGDDYIELTGSQSTNDYNSYTRHIATTNNGKTMDFYGYGSSGYKDFNFLSNNQATKKTIEFTIAEGTAYDALDGMGFLVNTSITGSYRDSQVINGYLVFLQYTSGGVGSSIKLFKLDNVNAYSLHHTMTGSTFDSNSITGASLVATASTSYGGSKGYNRKIKIEVMPDYLKMWYNGSSSNNAGYTFSDSDLVKWGIDNTTKQTLQAGYDGETYRGGYGPLISYRSHNCSQLTHFTLSNLSMVAEYVRSITEVVREPSWSDDRVSFLVNLNEDVIADFRDPLKKAELINRLEDDDITYVGWCGTKNVDETISFINTLAPGSGYVNINDTGKFTTTPYTDAAYKLQVAAVAKIIATKMKKQAAIDNVHTYLNTEEFTFTPSEGAALNDGKWSVGYSKDGFDKCSNEANVNTYQDLAAASFARNGYYEIYYNSDTTTPKAKIRIHQLPVAGFTAGIFNGEIVINGNKSYDPEFCTDISSATGSSEDGIETSKFEYKKLTTTNTEWSETAPDSIASGETWLVRLTVTDKDGAQANHIQQLSTATTGAAPYGSFELSKTQYIKGVDETVNITDTSYQLDGSTTGFTVTYKLKKPGGVTETLSLSQPRTTHKYDLTKLNEGTYTVSMTATKEGVTSEPVSKTFKVSQAYAVTYNPGQGVTDASGMPENTYKIKGATMIILSKAAPTRTGYNFVNWSGSDGKSYAPGAEYSTDAALTLTANWTAVKYKATLNGTNVTAKSGFGDSKATYHEEWTGTIEPANGYYLPEEKTDLEVKSGNRVIEEDDYDYDNLSGEITINADNVVGAVTITVTDEKSTPVFSKYEIREGSKTGAVIVDFLDSTSVASDWELVPGGDYYLCATLNKNSKLDAVKIRFGTKDNKSNGLTFANPPGGIFSTTEKSIVDDYFDKTLGYTNFTEPTYGTGNTKLSLRDGALIYHIKDNTKDTSFVIGLVINDAVYDNSGYISDAFRVSTGTSLGGYTPYAQQSEGVKVAAKNDLKTVLNYSTSTAEQGGVGNTIYMSALTNNVSTSQAAIKFDEYTLDITYPKGVNLEYGFNSTFVKTNGTYGELTMSEPVAAASVGGVEMVTRTLTITNGYKALASTVSVYYRLDFPASFAPGKYNFTLSNSKVTMGDKTIEPKVGNMKCVYTVTKNGLDATTMSAMNRPDVYNQTIDMESGSYMVPMGSVLIKNGNAGKNTPYDKTYEAKFNTSETSANISVITVPLGTSDTPQVKWTGKDADGKEYSGTLTQEQVLSMCYVKNNVEGSNGLIIHADEMVDEKGENLGIVTFTKVTADVGKLRPAYTTSSWTSNWAFGANYAGAFGYFTEHDNGIVVKNEYHLYNTNPEDRVYSGGDLQNNTTATSTDRLSAGMNAGTIKVNNAAIATDTSVSAGNTAKIIGTIYPYSVVRAVYDKSSGSTLYGTAMMINDPVFYLTLPSGISPKTDEFSFKKYYYDERGKAISAKTETLRYDYRQIGEVKDSITTYEIAIKTKDGGDKLNIGYYNSNGEYSTLGYTISLNTRKSLATQRYRLNDLISFTSADNVTAMPYANANNGTLVYSKKENTDLNGGNKIFGITKDKDETPIGFGVQQQADIVVDTEIKISKIAGEPVEKPEWYRYDITNPNSVAVLGQQSEGQIQLIVNNTSDLPGKGFDLVIPIPGKDVDLGAAFMDNPQEFTVAMEDKFATGSASGFDIKYGKINGTATDAEDFFSKKDAYTTDGVTKAGANALIITAPTLEKGMYELFIDYAVTNGDVAATDIWRPIYKYTVNTEDTRYRSAAYIASAVAGGEVEGIVFADTNQDGVKNGDESGIAEVEVLAKDAQGRTITTTTDSNGTYKFTAVRESAVTLTFAMPASQEMYRFNVAPVKSPTEGTISTTVTPSTDGMTASKTLYVSSNGTTIDAAAASFVTLSYNAGTGGSGSLPADTEYVSGKTATVAVKPDNLVRKGYKFKGWNTDIDGSGDLYQPGGTFTIENDVTLYAQWDVASYLVNFNYRGATGGNTEANRTVKYGSTYGGIKQLPTPTRIGYNFTGWLSTVPVATTVNGNVADKTTFATGVDTTLYAVWTPKEGFKVHYDTQGGSSIADSTLNWEGIVVPEDSVTEKTGYEFKGWKYNGTIIEEDAVYKELVASEDTIELTLEAVWSPKSGYTVEYDFDGGTLTSQAKSDVSWTDKQLLPVINPTKDLYAFDGWVLKGTEEKLTQDKYYGELAGADTTKSITINATWKEIEDNVVKYNVAGGTLINDKNGVKNSDSNLIPATTPTRFGYVFDGWYYNNEKVLASTAYSALSKADSITLTAKWQEQNCTVKYDTDTEATIGNKEVKWEEDSLLPSDTLTKVGHEFDGWYYGDKKVSNSDSLSTLVSGEALTAIVLKAKWKELSYTVQYDSMGGTYFTPKVNVKYSSKNILPDAAPVNTGYDFAGWHCDGAEVTNNTACKDIIGAVTDNKLTLTAHWVPKSGYIVNYDANGGTAVSPKEAVTWESAELLKDVNTTRKGYVLTGWQVGRKTVTDETVFYELTKDDSEGASVTLVAQWQQQSDFTVKYNTATGTDIENKENVTWNQRLLLPSTVLKKEGYAFIGWSTMSQTEIENESDPTKIILVRNSDTYNELAEDNSEAKSVTLTAVWEVKHNYIVSYDTDGGGSIADKNGVAWTGSDSAELIPNEVPVKYGYQFSGWYVDDTKVNATHEFGTLAAELGETDEVSGITLTARWSNKSYTLSYDTNGGDEGLVFEDRTDVQWNDEGIIPQETPVKKGYTFKGWYYRSKKVGETSSLQNLLPEDTGKKITLTAAWEINEYKVSMISETGYKLTPVNYDAKLNVLTPTDTTVVEYNNNSEFVLDIAAGYSKTKDFKVIVNGTPVELQSDEKGVYLIPEVDKDVTVSVEGVADITAPNAEVTMGTSKWNKFLNTISFGLFFDKTQSVTIDAHDAGSGVDKVRYYVSEKALTLKELEQLADGKDGWQEYSDGGFNIDPNSRNVIYVKATDQSGNAAYINSDGITLDTTAPLIQGVETDGQYNGSQKLNITDNYELASVMANGEEVLPLVKGGIYTLPASEDPYEIVATDKVGNTTVFSNVKLDFIKVDIPKLNNKYYTGENLMADVPKSDIYTVLQNKCGTDVIRVGYTVVLTLADPDSYKWNTSSPTQNTVQYGISKNGRNVSLRFYIKQAENYFEKGISCQDTVYGGSTAKASAAAHFGNNKLVYTYYVNSTCTQKTGPSAGGAKAAGGVPLNAGSYWVKASVAETANYTAISSEGKAFVIAKAGQEVPDVKHKNETSYNNNDGKITGIKENMQWSLDCIEWTDVTAKEIKTGKITNLKPGRYYIRYKDTENYEASEVTIVNIKEAKAVTGSVKSNEANHCSWHWYMFLLMATYILFIMTGKKKKLKTAVILFAVDTALTVALAVAGCCGLDIILAVITLAAAAASVLVKSLVSGEKG